MKYVQIGILGALLIVAGLLYKVYRGQSPQPAPVAAQTQPAVAEPAPAPAPAAEAAPPPAADTKPAPPAEPAREQRAAPRPNRRPSAAAPAVKQQEPALKPSDNTPAAPAPVPSTPAAQPPAAESTHVALNPPPRPEPPPPPPPREPQKVTIPAGTPVAVRLAETLTTERNQPGDTFLGTLDQALIIDGMAIAERGSKVEGRVVEAERAGRVKGLAALALQLVRLHTSDGQTVAVKTENFRKEGVASRGDDVKKVGVGAAIGAAIGAIAGGGKGAAIGAGVGGAAGTGTVMATRGKDVELPVETRMTFRLQEPVTLTEKLK